ncbi:MAG: arylamine N-acetyltransferase [Candidatus Krumholzibacteria bacterium]|nr:arylamine N-acetyltransferase [Candidatus Krumholzibacteria bacterium]
MDFEIWNNPLASGGQEAREILLGHFGLGAGGPELGMLRRIVECYSNLPYENLTKIIKKFTAGSAEERLRGPVEVVRGYVDCHTGGTCFSLTYCLGSILASAGYRCYPVMADMKRPNIHCALVVEMNERRFLVDPGYLVGEPVELAGSPVRMETTFGVVEIRPREGGRYDLFTLDAGERKWRYTVKTAPVSHAAFMRYWQDSFALPMMNNLLLTRLTPQGHLYVKNHHFRMKGAHGKVNENIRSDFESRIAADFGIPPGVTARAREHLERLKRTWRAREAAEREKA